MLDEDLQARKDFFRKALKVNLSDLKNSEIKEYIASNQSRESEVSPNYMLKRKTRNKFGVLLKELNSKGDEYLKKDKFIIQFRSMFSLNEGEKKMEQRKSRTVHSTKIKKEKKSINFVERKRNYDFYDVKSSDNITKNNEKIDLDFLMLKYRRKKGKFEMDLDDNRLKDLYINSEFFIDTLHPYYHKYSRLKQVHAKMINQKDVILKQKISLPILIKKLKSKQSLNIFRSIEKI